MAIQMRRGLRVDFDPAKMLPGEWAVAIDSDTANQIIWMCFAPGVVKQIGAYEDYERLIEEHYSEYIPDVLCTVEDGDNASRSYSTGDLFIFKGKMYAATANIASGDSLASASKKETTIEEELEGKQATLTFDTTPTENSNNPITSGGVKNALDAKQDSLTFDDSPSEGSQNPVKSGGIFTALNGKVDKITGKGLSTEDYTTEEKTKLSGIETGAQVNKVETVNSIQPDSNKNVSLNAENIPAEGIGNKTVSGNPITVTDALESTARDLQVEFGPIQDLHGYDHPWVGGAGKNLLPLTVDGLKSANTDGTWSGNAYTLNGVTFAIQTDADGNVTGILVNGTATANTNLLTPAKTYVAGAYTLNGCPQGGGDSSFMIWNAGRGLKDVGNGDATTLTTDSVWTFYVRIISGYTASNVLFKPMIRLTNETDATFEPYSNICPISGRTEVNVERTGKNLFDINSLIVGTIANNGGYAPDYATFRCTPYIFLEAGTYIITRATATSWWKGYIYDADKTPIRFSFNQQSTLSNTISLSKDLFMRFAFDYIPTESDLIQIEKGSTATAYQPYSLQSIQIPFGQTVYGGQVDFVTGKCRVTHANIASYNGETIGEPWWSSMDEYVSGTTPTIGAQVVYTLATPIELTLTPAQLSLLEGLNILATDGDNIILTYLGSEASNVQDEIDEFENGLNNVIGSIAFIENSTAKTSHAVGEYIILNGIFCKVISAVSSGETLSFGTNIQATTIGAELRAIWAQIQALSR